MEVLVNGVITGEISIPSIQNKNTLLISITAENISPRQRMGTLRIEALVDGDYFAYRSDALRLGKTSFFIPFPEYRVVFTPTLDSRYLSIPSITIAATQMIVLQAPYTAPLVGSETFKEVIPVAPSAQDPVFVIVEAGARKTIAIQNKSNRNLHLKLGDKADEPTLVAADPFVMVGAGATYTTSDYHGEICGIMSANFSNGSKIIVRELPLITE